MSKIEYEPNRELVSDIQDLCVCCAKAIVEISKKHNISPRIVSKFFIEVYQKINSDVDASMEK